MAVNLIIACLLVIYLTVGASEKHAVEFLFFLQELTIVIRMKIVIKVRKCRIRVFIFDNLKFRNVVLTWQVMCRALSRLCRMFSSPTTVVGCYNTYPY